MGKEQPGEYPKIVGLGSSNEGAEVMVQKSEGSTPVRLPLHLLDQELIDKRNSYLSEIKK